MIVDGERIKHLLRGASREVILCSPFIKTNTLRVVLETIPQFVSVRIVTRWRPTEVAAGVSDLAVFDIARERQNTKVDLLQSLHAKLYLADDNCLVGSANLTATGLGWCENSNVEILLSVRRSDPDVGRLLYLLESAIPATFQIRSEVEKEVAALESVKLIDAQDIPSNMVPILSAVWLPRCATPESLYSVYRDPRTTVVVEGTRADAMVDLAALLPPPELEKEDFVTYVRSTLQQLPAFRRILDSIPARLTDTDGEMIVGDLRQDLSQGDSTRQWRIVRAWIGEFFGNRFEVAPESYVVRLRSR